MCEDKKIIFYCANTEMRVTEFCAWQYLKESSTKVVQTLFLMILGIQLYKYNKDLGENFAVSDSGSHWRRTPVRNVDFGSLNDVVIGRSVAFICRTLVWDFWRGAEVSAFIVCVCVCASHWMTVWACGWWGGRLPVQGGLLSTYHTFCMETTNLLHI